ncbi:hypothetical protein [Brevibacillus laterosporus]|uniref:hypothetical protein n=1 Tax=Brevibacillus laterosporus TaxID=1465 RepID=UPI002E1C4AC9|nr:hypothetical protein [Brevibacillus laterosporus]MED1667201.1 hypothetical protein [Brevibacillus laterosporus]MED1719731.1 hypothetical protein [Brevibacillus laterosporus]
MIYSDYQELQVRLRNEINIKRKSQGLKLNKLAELLGIDNVTNLTRTLRPSDSIDRKFNVEMIDSITSILCLPEGYFYPLFLGELRRKTKKNESGTFIEGKTKDFIKRCLDLSLYDIVSGLIEEVINEKNTKVIFDLAEEIFSHAEEKYPYDPSTVNYKQPEYTHALYLYQLIAEKEKSFSPQLAVCYLRIFYLLRFDPQQVHERFILMKNFIRFMPEDEQLVAYERVCAYYKMYFKWDKLYEAAVTLEELAKEKNEDKFGFALVSKGFALNGLHKYNEALKVINEYKNINGFVEQAIINQLITQIHLGDMTKADELIEIALKTPSPTKESTLAIVLEKYSETGQIDSALKLMEKCNQHLNLDKNDKTHLAFKIMKFKRAEGLIHIQNQAFEKGISRLLESAEIAIHLNLTPEFGELIALLSKNIENANDDQKELLYKLYKNNERR